ncbi:hypothetical protein, partial [Brevundimonas sp.]|uniref:hypothetical protein n=1 Tax=Brevundimonas sp. TaxID=1871086 RepID=UPI002898C181
MRDRPEVLIVASDKRKEALIEAALPYIEASVRLLIGGFDHFRYRDPTFEQETANALVPSDVPLSFHPAATRVLGLVT